MFGVDIAAWAAKNVWALVGVPSLSALLGLILKRYVTQEMVSDGFEEWKARNEPKLLRFGVGLGKVCTLFLSKLPGFGLIWHYLVEPIVILVGGFLVSLFGWLLLVVWQGWVIGAQSDHPNFAGQTAGDKKELVKRILGK